MSEYPVNNPIVYTALAATQGAPDATFSYAWTFDDGGTGNTASLAHTWASTGKHNASVTATDTATLGSASANVGIYVVGKYSVTGSLITGRCGAQSILLDNGKVLVVGGFTQYDQTNSPGITLASCELYDPNTGTFSSTGSMIASRGWGHRLTKLANGDILVVGGRKSNRNNYMLYIPGGEDSINTCEIYSVAAGTWSSTGSMATTRRDHFQATLPSGKIIAGGGVSISGIVSTTEIYDPGLGTWSAGPALPFTLYMAATDTTSDGRIVIAGGLANGTSPVNLLVYTEGGSFVARAQYINPPANGKISGGLKVFTDKYLFCGGSPGSGGYGYDFGIYSVSGDSWTYNNSDTTGLDFIYSSYCNTSTGIIATVYGKSVIYYSPTKYIYLGDVAKTSWLSTITNLGNGYAMVCGGADNASYQTAISDAYLYYVGV